MVLFSTRLKELRKEVGLTQKQLGEMVGVTKVSICCYENGTRTPTLDTLIDLANSLGVDLAYLLGVDTFMVAEDDMKCSINLAKDEIELIRELRMHIKLYEKLITDPKRTIEYIEKKMRLFLI